jgi:SlyX protein
LNESIKRLEEKVAFLERHVTEQDKAMLEFAEELAALRREIASVRDRARSSIADESVDEPNDLPDERPPHY